MNTKSALCLDLSFKTISLISSSISFSLFRRHWKQFITHSQGFFRGTRDGFYIWLTTLLQMIRKRQSRFSLQLKSNFQPYPNSSKNCRLPHQHTHHGTSRCLSPWRPYVLKTQSLTCLNKPLTSVAMTYLFYIIWIPMFCLVLVQGS